MDDKVIHRGEVWYHVPSYKTSGHIQGGARPVIIVSNEFANLNSSVLLAVPCTTKTLKKCKPTHVEFYLNGVLNLAICEQAGPISVEDLDNFKCRIPQEVMEEVDSALKVAFGLDPKYNRTGAVRFYNKYPELKDGARKG